MLHVLWVWTNVCHMSTIMILYRVCQCPKNPLFSTCLFISPHLHPGKNWSIYWLWFLPFPECHSQNHMVDNFFQMGFFHLVICIYSSCVFFHRLKAPFFLQLSNPPLSGCATVYSFIHFLKDILMAILYKATTFMCVFLWGYEFSVHLCK